MSSPRPATERVSAILKALQGGEGLFTTQVRQARIHNPESGDELALIDPISGQQSGTAIEAAH